MYDINRHSVEDNDAWKEARYNVYSLLALSMWEPNIDKKTYEHILNMYILELSYLLEGYSNECRVSLVFLIKYSFSTTTTSTRTVLT